MYVVLMELIQSKEYDFKVFHDTSVYWQCRDEIERLVLELVEVLKKKNINSYVG